MKTSRIFLGSVVSLVLIAPELLHATIGTNITDQQRFPRVAIRGGKSLEVLSPLSETNREADARGFAAFLRHLREVDQRHTVIMVQVENEVGVIGDSRDRSAAANAAFAQPVPVARKPRW